VDILKTQSSNLANTCPHIQLQSNKPSYIVISYAASFPYPV